MCKTLIHYIDKALSALLIGLIQAYRYCISPLLGARCRFSPTCSQYARQSVEIYGAFKGSWLALVRILKCHPLHSGGYDPVPKNTHKNRRCLDGHK